MRCLHLLFGENLPLAEEATCGEEFFGLRARECEKLQESSNKSIKLTGSLFSRAAISFRRAFFLFWTLTRRRGGSTPAPKSKCSRSESLVIKASLLPTIELSRLRNRRPCHFPTIHSACISLERFSLGCFVMEMTEKKSMIHARATTKAF
jgi:hypothetical protein